MQNLLKKDQVSCESCKAKKCFIIKHVKPELLKEINATKSVSIYERDQVIFQEGTPVGGLYFIKSGKVKIFLTRNNKDQIIRLAKTGEILGHRGLGGNNLYPISASALEDSIICFVPKEQLLKQLQYNPSLAYNLTMFYAGELNQSEKRWHAHYKASFRERMVDALLMVLNSLHDKVIVGKVIDIYLTRKELGNIALSAPEQISRELTWLKEQGIIDTAGHRKIIIKDYNRLVKIVAHTGLGNYKKMG